MVKLLILGATGNLGSALTRQALERGHHVTVLVRDPGRLPPATAERVTVRQGDLSNLSITALTALMEGQDAVLNTAGNVADGPVFVDLLDRIATAAEACTGSVVVWVLAGAALLDLDSKGRKGLDLPMVSRRYAPHGANLARLQKSALDWRLLCPGPMVDEPGVGLERLRISTDLFPVALPGWTSAAPAVAVLPVFAANVGKITLPYADAAAVMLENLTPGGAMSRRRIGIALPEGMSKRKSE